MTIRVHALAKELGVTPSEMLEEIRAEGEHISSARSAVPEPIARLLRERYGVPAPKAIKPVPPPYAPPPAFALRPPPVRRLAKDWSPLVFEMDLDEIEQWLRIKPEVHYWTARHMCAAKITASEAQLSIWNGRSRADRPRLVDMVLVGDIEPVEAAAQLRAWREAGSPQYGSGA